MTEGPDNPLEPRFAEPNDSTGLIAPGESSASPKLPTSAFSSEDSPPSRGARARAWIGSKIAGTAAAVQRSLQNLTAKPGSGPRANPPSRHLATAGKALTVILCAYFLSDLIAILGGRYIPEPPIASGYRRGPPSRRVRTIEEYNVIFARNLFNSAGKIPGEDESVPSTNTNDLGGPAVRTTLPFNLVGTMIMQSEALSIATIEDKSATMVYPVRVEDEIPGKAKIIMIEAKKVTFINTATGRREFVDIPEDPNAPPKMVINARPAAGGKVGIEKLSATQFNISRTEVDKTLSDLNNVLTQARAVPNFENGVASGYKLFQIVPGSIYDKLGLQNGDVIAGLNGAAINDPGKAFEMLSELKTQNHLELQVKKDGRTQTYSYDIR